MKKILLFDLFLTILIICTVQQTTQPTTQQTTPIHTNDPFQQFNNAIKRNLNENNSTTDLDIIMNERLRKQVVIWTSIGLSIVLYFSVMAIINMSNPKSSILYAKYDTTKGGNEL